MSCQKVKLNNKPAKPIWKQYSFFYLKTYFYNVCFLLSSCFISSSLYVCVQNPCLLMTVLPGCLSWIIWFPSVLFVISYSPHWSYVVQLLSHYFSLLFLYQYFSIHFASSVFIFDCSCFCFSSNSFFASKWAIYLALAAFTEVIKSRFNG